MSPIALTPDQQGALWRQRMFEAHSAMTAYLIEQHRPEDLADWVQVTEKIYHDLPSPQVGDSTQWQAVFFRAQALIEQFIVQRAGVYDLDDWATATGQVYRALEPAGQGDPQVAAERLGRQASLYGTRFDIQALSAKGALFKVHHCGIWDYRERARARGVPITLKSACTYCTKLLSSLVQAKGCNARWELFSDPQDHGCEWTITPDSLNSTLTGRLEHERDY
ncbi:putative uncharacterized protein [Pseudomonas sp. StFLB209]|uniref:hypothetical protein n=1 Tax=Pseudomonas sp. StFLB209 TaxID=1028989 RepID=UPI0004F7BC21|nr:hypothetical protein [Pseudomonas sp. StFLB209]BAP42086.1 putative uncharacterized protein [Pseudomonas sp. StFLB209]